MASSMCKVSFYLITINEVQNAFNYYFSAVFLNPFCSKAHLNNFVGLISLSSRNRFSSIVSETETHSVVPAFFILSKLYKLYNKFKCLSMYCIYCISCISDLVMDNRQIRGLAILSKGDTPILVRENEWLVPSQSTEKKYKVQNAELWTCECLDFQTRKQPCKHIHAIQFYLKLRNKAEVSDFDIEQEVNKADCPFCHSEKIVKNGARKTNAGIKQRFKCLDCSKRFVLEPIKYCKANAKIICLAMDLYFKGLSLRDISDTIFQFYNQRIHFDTIRRWISKFTKKMNDYTEQFTPQLSGTIHTDEQMVKSKGKWVWAWNSIDEETRFLLASTVTAHKELSDGRKHFQEVKKATNDKRPKQIVTDGLRLYRSAINKEFRTKINETSHISIVGRRKKIHNNLIERYHNDFREFDKVRRGFKSNKTTQDWANGFKLYHNFIHKNTGIGTTPAQKAGIELNLERNKWESLIRKTRNIV